MPAIAILSALLLGPIASAHCRVPDAFTSVREYNPWIRCRAP